MPLDAAVAAVRLAVRRELEAGLDGGADGPVIVACSGGADSLALLAAAVHELRRRATRVVGVSVDHGLQDGSSAHAARVVAQMTALGADESLAVRVEVDPAGRGIEAAARESRYAALNDTADRTGSGVVLLGHTLDDQAETVLLGLARGSGGRSIAGMSRVAGRFHRPLLGLTRAQTVAACTAEGIEFWRDPHNDDPAFTRSRVRHQVLPVLESELGPGIAAALARTAEMLQEDTDALDDLASSLREQLGLTKELNVDRLASLHPALRRRILRAAAVEAGALPGDLFRTHVLALDDLVHGPRGREVQLPGHLSAHRDGSLLVFGRTGP